MTFESVDVESGPEFTISEFARVFVARNDHTVRWWEREGKMRPPRRRTNGVRIWNLADVERSLDDLRGSGMLTEAQYRAGVDASIAVGRAYGLLPDLPRAPISDDEKATIRRVAVALGAATFHVGGGDVRYADVSPVADDGSFLVTFGATTVRVTVREQR